MSKTKSAVTQLLIAVCGVFIALFAIWMFNQNLLMSFPMPARMVLMIVTQWSLFLVPLILMIINKEKLRHIGINTKGLPLQIGIGILLAISMSLFFTIPPILLGFKDMVGTTSYTKTWQFVYNFIYSILGVALAEELVFRGYIFKKLFEIKSSKWFAIIVSSLVFGLFHVLNFNLIQIISTTLLGILFCLFREKIKGCTLISLIIAHGTHNALITLWVFLL